MQTATAAFVTAAGRSVVTDNIAPKGLTGTQVKERLAKWLKDLRNLEKVSTTLFYRTFARVVN